MDRNSEITLRLSPEYIMGGYTGVDNIFICEYLKNLDGVEVKLYLYGLYLAHTSIPTTMESVCEYIGADEDDILTAISHLEDEGLLDLISREPFEILFHPLLATYSKPRKIKAGKYDDFNKQLQSIASGRMLTPTDFTECYNILELYHIEPSAFLVLASYCVSIKGNNISIKYITATAKNFAYKKITTLKAVEKELEQYRLQSSFMAVVIKKLGLKKQVELEDSQFIQKWKDLGFDEDGITTAALLVKGKGASMRKLDALILELYNYKKFTKKEIADFAESKAQMKDLAISINKALSVYYESLEAEINTYIVKWLNLGYADDILIKIADFCFINNLRSLREMDDTVAKLYKKGVISTNSFDDYIERSNKKDEEIAKLLEILNIDRRVNSYDRKNYLRFEELGFTEEMIARAGALSKNASSPYPYMSSILISWKNKNIFRIEDIGQVETPKTSAPKSSKVRESMTNEYTKEQLSAVYTSLDDLDF